MTFPGFEKVGDSFSFVEEWYTLKDFRPEIHVLTVFNDPALEGDDYKRPPFPNCWAKNEGKGRVFYTAMGHREDVWTNATFQQILVGALKWANGDAKAPDMTPNLLEGRPGRHDEPALHPDARPQGQGAGEEA